MQKLRGLVTLSLIILLLSTLVLAQTNDPNSSSFKEKTDSITSKEITLPKGLYEVLNLFFGINNLIEISLLIMLIGISVIILIILGQSCKLIPFFEGKFIPWITASIITLIIGVSGGLKFIATSILAVSESFKFLKNWSTGALVFSLILIFTTMALIIKLEKYLKQKSDITNAQVEGMQIGRELGFLSRMREFMGSFRNAP